MELLARYPSLRIDAIAAEYEEGLEHLHSRDPARHLVLWLGSSIGNLTREEAAIFLRGLNDSLSEADRLLVGIDLRKDGATLERAYDDSQGVTARFNLNLLARINRELAGDFDSADFDFRAIYREEAGVVQSYLISRRDHSVRVGALDLEAHFEADEPIHTEDSHKYSQQEIDALAQRAGLKREASWEDARSYFSLVLLAPS